MIFTTCYNCCIWISSNYISKIVGNKVNVNDRNEIVVTVSNGIYVSRDLGTNWEFYTISKDYNNYYYAYNLNIDYLFVNNKFYQSFDNKKTWNQLKTINYNILFRCF